MNYDVKRQQQLNPVLEEAVKLVMDNINGCWDVGGYSFETYYRPCLLAYGIRVCPVSLPEHEMRERFTGQLSETGNGHLGDSEVFDEAHFEFAYLVKQLGERLDSLYFDQSEEKFELIWKAEDSDDLLMMELYLHPQDWDDESDEEDE